MNAQQILDSARTNNWNRKQVKQACFDHKIDLAERESIYAALGMAPTGPAQVVGQPAAKSATAISPVATPIARRGNMTLKFPAQDCLTGLPLEAGTDVTGVKLGGTWDFTAEPIGAGEFRKLREAVLTSMDDEAEQILDHEDYSLLAEFGRKYSHVAAIIGVEVPGLE